MPSSRQPVAVSRVITGRNTKDFGPGFSCTILREQAVRWARRYDTPVVSSYDVRLDDGLDIPEFGEMADDWLDFIIACRSGKPHARDIVIGAMAYDRVYNYVSDCIEGTITHSRFWALAKFKYPARQIAFCTQRALGRLSYIGFAKGH